MNLIYVASPYRGDIKNNIEYAKECCNFVSNQGYNFFCPHLMYTQVLNDDITEERELGINLAKEMLLKCDSIWVFGTNITEGMFFEMEHAKNNNIPIKRVLSLEQVQNMEQNIC